MQLKPVFFTYYMDPFWLSEFCLLLACSSMYLLEQKNAIKRFLTICFGSFCILTLLLIYCTKEKHKHFAKLLKTNQEYIE